MTIEIVRPKGKTVELVEITRTRQARYRATAKGKEAEQRYRHSIPGRKAGADAAARYRARKAKDQLDLDAMLQE